MKGSLIFIKCWENSGIKMGEAGEMAQHGSSQLSNVCPGSRESNILFWLSLTLHTCDTLRYMHIYTAHHTHKKKGMEL